MGIHPNNRVLIIGRENKFFSSPKRPTGSGPKLPLQSVPQLMHGGKAAEA
jgi:hypothetical protein